MGRAYQEREGSARRHRRVYLGRDGLGPWRTARIAFRDLELGSRQGRNQLFTVRRGGEGIGAGKYSTYRVSRWRRTGLRNATRQVRQTAHNDCERRQNGRQRGRHANAADADQGARAEAVGCGCWLLAAGCWLLAAGSGHSRCAHAFPMRCATSSSSRSCCHSCLPQSRTLFGKSAGKHASLLSSPGSRPF